MSTPTYEALATVTLAVDTASVTFSSIPATYRDLVLVLEGTLTSGEGVLTAVINGDTGANYSRVHIGGGGASGFSGEASGNNELQFGFITNVRHSSITQFMDYSATDKHKTVLNRSNNPTVTTFGWTSRYANNNAITSLLIDTSSAGSFGAGTTLNLYGIES